ncbi:fimbria/pilus outer membrane usher protein [Scleromatobacter humisilvae]|uniref:Fimbria/pilus outer membrane usher protein n=1 Tax=Scleromatobacter humisilvae TaxID=2897159 RepID=A0A9X1YIV1_9BURK|nr:fimbria/pilus outer membrane usher protein [Scleromatobacter humisilvae]MCK9687309.1 fimbria/pilus outer membrane usher protein [Scleromatobacter humisilvae]
MLENVGVATPTGSRPALIDLVVDASGDSYLASLAELRGLSRVRWNLVGSEAGQVRLADLGVVRYDELSGELHVTVRSELLQPQVVGMGSIQTVIPDSAPASAAFIDYDLQTQILNNRTQCGLLLNGVEYIGLNRIELSGSTGDSQGTRLYQAHLVRESLEDSSLLEAGSVVGMAGARGNPAAMVGIGMRRDQSVTPGFITGPQLRVNGVSSGQSTVDVLIDNQRVSSAQVSAGSFSVVAQPIAEAGVAQVVVRDELGQQQVVSAQLFSNPMLLEVGQSEYGAWVGGLNTENLKSQGSAAIGYYRRGLTRWLTAETSYEGSLATEVAPAISRLAFSADVATMAGDLSVDVRGLGGAGQVSMTYSAVHRVGAWTVNAGGQATHSDAGYYNVGGGLVQRYNYSGTLGASAYGGSSYVTMAQSPAGKLKQVGGSYRLDAIGATLSLSVSRFESGTQKSNSAFLGLSIPFGGGVSGNFTTRSSSDGIVKRVAINGAIDRNVYGGLSTEGVHGFDRTQADLTATMGPTRLLANVAQVNGQPLAAQAFLRGSVVLHRGGVAFVPTQYSDGGFALVDLGAPGVVVRNSFGANATTDAAGYAVVPMPSLRSVQLRIDPDTAPDGLDLSPVPAVAYRKGAFEFRRRAVHGQFVQVAGHTTGTLVVDGVEYPVTDRGAWVELASGHYVGQAGGVSVDFTAF